MVLNSVATEVIKRRRGINSQYVFTFRQKPILRMLNTGWKTARTRSKLYGLRVHDLKHTFGHRLSAAGVNFEHRQILLGHKLGKITEHYSPADVKNLLESANKVCIEKSSQPTIIRRLRPDIPVNFTTGQDLVKKQKVRKALKTLVGPLGLEPRTNGL